MKVSQFIDTLKKICNSKTEYRLGGIGEHNGDLWYFDCVGVIKSVLWEFEFDTQYRRGGAVYESNGVPDVGADKMFSEYCYNKSNDFTKIEVGELVWMDGHIGTYIGDRKVIESTSAWEGKVVISDLGNNGERTRNGRKIYSWEYHGKCKFIDYEPIEVPRKYEAGTTVLVNGYAHKTKDADSETLGYFENYVGEIIQVEKYECEYPYTIRNLGCVREKYLSNYVPPKEEPKEEPIKKEKTLWQKFIELIIDLLKAFLGKED